MRDITTLARQNLGGIHKISYDYSEVKGAVQLMKVNLHNSSLKLTS